MNLLSQNHVTGDGRLIEHLEKHGGICRYAYDIEPMHERVEKYDALGHGYTQCDYIITNPFMGIVKFYIL